MPTPEAKTSELSEDDLLKETELKMTSLFYDVDAAVELAGKAAKVDPEVALTILVSRDRYLLGLGVIPDDPDMGTTPAELRAAHPELFPPGNIAAGLESTTLERKFIALDTGIDKKIVDAVMDADEVYMRQQGIVVDVLCWGSVADGD